MVQYFERMIHIKRVYDRAGVEDGTRFLVERLWPRGIRKEDMIMEAWVKAVAPSDELRRWFAHDPQKWPGFQTRYRSELVANPQSWQPLLEAARHGTITLLISARDAEHNNALVLKDFLEAKLNQPD